LGGAHIASTVGPSMSSFRRHQILGILGAAIVVSPAGAAAQATQRADAKFVSKILIFIFILYVWHPRHHGESNSVSRSF